jgi:hypothetical protein
VSVVQLEQTTNARFWKIVAALEAERQEVWVRVALSASESRDQITDWKRVRLDNGTNPEQITWDITEKVTLRWCHVVIEGSSGEGDGPLYDPISLRPKDTVSILPRTLHVIL